MSGAGVCPHPEKKRWPLCDVEGPRCRCGHVWAPWQFVASANLYFASVGSTSRLEVYLCRDRAGARLDHWHTTDRGKREHDRVDAPVKDGVASTQDIQKPGWSGRRKAKPVSRSERRRLRRHRRM